MLVLYSVSAYIIKKWVLSMARQNSLYKVSWVSVYVSVSEVKKLAFFRRWADSLLYNIMKWARPTGGDGIWDVRWRRPTATTATTAYRGWRRRRPTSWTDYSHSRRAVSRRRHSRGSCCCWCWGVWSSTDPRAPSARGSDILQSLLAPETRTPTATLFICPQYLCVLNLKMSRKYFQQK